MKNYIILINTLSVHKQKLKIIQEEIKKEEEVLMGLRECSSLYTVQFRNDYYRELEIINEIELKLSSLYIS